MRTQVQPVENKANGDTRSDTSYPPTAGTSPPPPAKSTTKHLGSLRTKVSLPNPDPLVPKTAPAPDPRIDLVRQAREMADKVERMHQQLDSELQQLWKERDDDVDISTTNRGPLTHEQAVDLNEQIKHSWDGPEQEIRDGAAARFQKCCLQDAIRIREQLMIEAPGVSTYQDGNTYQNNPGHNPGYSMGDYHTISQDLNKLANAVEVKIKFAGTESR